MQKALQQMNLHLHHVVSDISGPEWFCALSRRFWRANVIPSQLAKLRDPRVRKKHRSPDGSCPSR